MYCKICNRFCNSYRALGIHIRNSHKNISLEEYYKKYINENDGICKHCGNKCNFISLTKGFHTYCCLNCQVNSIESNNKRRETKFKHFGYGNYISKEKIEFISKTNKENVEQRKETFKNTCLKKYGIDHIAKLDFVKEKKAKTNIKKYGNKCSIHGINQNKTLKTMNERYGCNAVAQRYDYLSKMHKKYNFDNKKFDSSWEMAYYAYLKDHNIDFEYHPNIVFSYEINGIKHNYFPDFIVNNELIEIKGNHLLEGIMKIPDEKIKCMKDNNIKILLYDDIKEYIIYFKEKYGNIKNYKF